MEGGRERDAEVSGWISRNVFTLLRSPRQKIWKDELACQKR